MLNNESNKKGWWVYKYIFVVVVSTLIFLLLLSKLHLFTDTLSKKSRVIYFVFLSLSIIIADKYPIDYFPQKENRAEVTLSLSLNLAVAFIFTPSYAIIFTIITNIAAELFVRGKEFSRKWIKVLFNTAYLSIVIGTTSVIFHKFYNLNLSFISMHNILVLSIAGITYILIESFILFGLLSYINNEPFWKYWWKNIKAAQLDLLTLFPLGYLLIYLYLTNFWISVLLIPLFVAIYFASKEKIEIIQQTEKTLYVLAKIEDDKTPDTRRHSERVANLVEKLCEVAYSSKISEDEKDIIVKSARLHDIGKIAISDKILEKKGDLTDDEWNQIRSHPEKGKEIVENLRTFGDGPEIILHHHEKWDGSGYPDGLKEEEIPLGSRIICVADSFDAMISKRPYKQQKSIEDALEEIHTDKEKKKKEKEKGEQQFDPYAADAFYDMVNEMLKDKSITKNSEEWEKYFPKDAIIHTPKTKNKTEK